MVIIEESQRIDQLLVLPWDVNANDLLFVDLQLFKFDFLDAGRGLDLGCDFKVELAVNGGTVTNSAKLGLKSKRDKFDIQSVMVVSQGAVELAEAVEAFYWFLALVQGH